MPYARLDDRYDDHRKIRRAWRLDPAAVAMHAMAIARANRHNSDGLVEMEWVDAKLVLLPYSPKKRLRVVEILLEVGLFDVHDDEHYLIHHFLDWNLSSEQRRQLSQQGRRGGQAKGKPSLSQGLSQGLSESGVGGLSTPFATPTPTPTPTTNTNAELRSAVVECFAYWQERCGHPQAQLSSDRRGKIEARIRERSKLAGGIPEAIRDIRSAIDGAARSPYIDDKGKRFDDIELICRNGSKLEDFMARASAEPRPPLRVVGKHSPSDLLRQIRTTEESA